MMKIVALALAATLSAVEATKAQQELRIGLMNAEPGVIQQGKQTTGRDIDIWDAIAKDTGLRVTYVLLSSPQAVLTALDEGKVDVAGWTSTTSAKYLLSVTILPTAEALVVPKADAREYRGVHDIKAMTVATLRATAYADHLKKSGIAGVREFGALPEVLNAVTSKEADAAMFSGIIAGYMATQDKLPGLRVVRSYQPDLSRPVVAAFPKGSADAHAKVNASLTRLHADGTMARIRSKYGL